MVAVRRFAVVPVVLCALAGAFVAPARSAGFPDAASADSARRGAAYLASRQGADGRVPPTAYLSRVAEAVVALVAGGGQEDAVKRALDHIAANGESWLRSPYPADANGSNGPRIGLVVWALVAAGENPRNFGGVDWVHELELRHSPGTGSYGGENFYADLVALLAVLTAGEELPAGAVGWVENRQCHEPNDPAIDGGWTWEPTCVNATPDTDTTALAISVLTAASDTDVEVIRNGRDWLLGARRHAGCWGTASAGTIENANSCGLAISAVLALCEDPHTSPWADGEEDPVARLRSLQLESGAFALRPGNDKANDYATIQAVPAVAGWSYPVGWECAPGPGEEDPEPGAGGTTPSTRATSTPSTRGDAPGDERAGSAARAPSSTAAASVRGQEPDPTSTTVLPRAREGIGARGSRSLGPVPAIEVSGDGDGGARPARSAGSLAPGGSVTVRETGVDGRGMGVPAGVAGGGLGAASAGTGLVWRRRRFLTAALETIPLD